MSESSLFLAWGVPGSGRPVQIHKLLFTVEMQCWYKDAKDSNSWASGRAHSLKEQTLWMDYQNRVRVRPLQCEPGAVGSVDREEGRHWESHCDFLSCLVCEVNSENRNIPHFNSLRRWWSHTLKHSFHIWFIFIMFSKLLIIYQVNTDEKIFKPLIALTIIYGICILAFKSSNMHPCLLKNRILKTICCGRELQFPSHRDRGSTARWVGIGGHGLGTDSGCTTYCDLGMLINLSVPQFSICKRGWFQHQSCGDIVLIHWVKIYKAFRKNPGQIGMSFQ